jgi:hypothetical protein
MVEIRRATKYVRDQSGRVVLQRDSSASITSTARSKKPAQAPATKKPAPPPVTTRKKLLQLLAALKVQLAAVSKKISHFTRSLPLPKKILAATVICLSIAGVVLIAVRTDDKSPKADNPSANNAVLESLEYQTVLPGGRSISELGGWKRVSPPESDAVYAYTDKINDIEVSVSQQPIPGSFIGNIPDGIAKLAKEYNATNSLNTTAGVKAYIGVSSKGPQSVIFTKNNLLILIKSRKNIEDKDWILYIDSLN